MLAWQKDDGFSLVETLLVVAIVGMMAGVAVLSLPPGDDSLQQKLTRSKAALTAISRQSVISGRVYGLKINEQGYQVQVLADDGWLEETDILKPEVQRWDPLALVSVIVEGASLDVGNEINRPHIWFLPTGEYPAFELRFLHGGETVIIETAGSGSMIEAGYAD